MSPSHCFAAEHPQTVRSPGRPRSRIRIAASRSQGHGRSIPDETPIPPARRRQHRFEALRRMVVRRRPDAGSFTLAQFRCRWATVADLANGLGCVRPAPPRRGHRDASRDFASGVRGAGCHGSDYRGISGTILARTAFHGPSGTRRTASLGRPVVENPAPCNAGGSLGTTGSAFAGTTSSCTA